MDLRAMALDQLTAADPADPVGDRDADHVPDHPRQDDPEQRQLAVVDVEAREQHRRLGPRHGDHAGDQDHQPDPGVPEVIDDMCSQRDQPAGHRGEGDEHRRQA